jgi:hypothetical protein
MAARPQISGRDAAYARPLATAGLGHRSLVSPIRANDRVGATTRARPIAKGWLNRAESHHPSGQNSFDRHGRCSRWSALDRPRVVDIEIDIVIHGEPRRGYHRHAIHQVNAVPCTLGDDGIKVEIVRFSDRGAKEGQR